MAGTYFSSLVTDATQTFALGTRLTEQVTPTDPSFPTDPLHVIRGLYPTDPIKPLAEHLRLITGPDLSPGSNDGWLLF